AMGLAPGMTVLDCTLGLATDAIVASFVTGPKGKVTGLESSPVLALVAKYGLGSFTAESNEITAALRRIEVKCDDHRVYLQEQPDASVDVVFFDPMFRVPIASSSNLKPLRYLANPQPLSKEIIKEAARVARRRIVVKEAQASGALRELGFALTVGGKYSSVQYGVMEVCH
ncbi:MAG: class I SAM-dependent methyltransferase, partial [Negativicutes bacterium]|nr:class I SAM-dependent methyltransferase [Negativicutes bacterium]